MLLLEFAGEPRVLAAMAARAGWRVVEDTAGDTPHLIVVTRGSAIAAIRAGPSARAAAPVVLIAADRGTPAPPGADEVVAPPVDEATARAILDRWRPHGLEALERVAAVLGAVAVDDLLVRLRDQLEAALGGDTPADAAQRAHRLAGIAGMLGFAALGEAWLAVERGVPDAPHAARIETRHALAAIARRRGDARA